MIIQPSINDYEELITVWEGSVRATHHFVSEEDIQFYKPLILNEYFPSVKLFCEKDVRQTIAGFMGIVDDKLEMLFVDPARRGQGIGKRLLLFAISVQGVRKVDVNEQNEQAVAFYQHMGFQIKSRSETDASGKNYPILSMEIHSPNS